MIAAVKLASSVALVEVSYILITGELQLRIRPKHTTIGILKMDSGSDTGNSNTENDFVVLNKEGQEEQKSGSTEENKENEEIEDIDVNSRQSKKANMRKEWDIKEKIGQLLKSGREASGDITTPNISNLDVITAITEVMDFEYRWVYLSKFLFQFYLKLVQMKQEKVRYVASYHSFRCEIFNFKYLCEPFYLEWIKFLLEFYLIFYLISCPLMRPIDLLNNISVFNIYPKVYH